jgi:hypothetical protein
MKYIPPGYKAREALFENLCSATTTPSKENKKSELLSAVEDFMTSSLLLFAICSRPPT